MAKYDRRLLVPYLRDVCSVELLLYKLEKEKEKNQKRMWSEKWRLEKDQRPAEIEAYSLKACNQFIAYSIGLSMPYIFCILFYDGFMQNKLLYFILGSCCVVAGFFLVCAWDEWKNYRKRFWKIAENHTLISAYESRQDDRNKIKNRMDYWQVQVNDVEKRIKEVETLRKEVYDSNIIPKQYRNIYATHFLYEYFSTSQESDLDKIIQLFVLEEIKAKLDQIIEQQTEMLLNQRCMLAKQEYANKIARENHEQNMRQIAMLNQNVAHQGRYLEMINTHLMVSNYFAYHEYIDKRSI